MSTLEAWREQRSHVHHFTPLTDAIEKCSCGMLRPICPDER